MADTKIGFIGLGNVGGKLAGNLLRNGVDLTVRDLNADLEAEFVAKGAKRGASPRDIAKLWSVHYSANRGRVATHYSHSSFFTLLPEATS